MNLRAFVTLLAIFCFAGGETKSQHRDFNIATFYKTLASENISDINAQLGILSGSLVAEKDAYEGALLMKKSGLLIKAKDKLNTFKNGRLKLENSISGNRNNTEFRFLRLIIQEQAPKIVKYRSNLDEDKQNILANFKNLSPILQQVMQNYSEKSTVLKIP